MSYEEQVAEMPPPSAQATLLANVIGFGAFGLAARLGQLSILKRNPWSNLWGHGLSVGFWGWFGYQAYFWDQRMEEVIWEKRKDILARRAERSQTLEALAADSAERRAALALEAETH